MPNWTPFQLHRAGKKKPPTSGWYLHITGCTLSRAAWRTMWPCHERARKRWPTISAVTALLAPGCSWAEGEDGRFRRLVSATSRTAETTGVNHLNVTPTNGISAGANSRNSYRRPLPQAARRICRVTPQQYRISKYIALTSRGSPHGRERPDL